MEKIKTDKDFEKEYLLMVENIAKDTAVIGLETDKEKAKRIRRLEAPGNQEAWFKYYFPKYCFAAPAPFQINSSKRIFDACDKMLANGAGKFYQSRKWARGLSKSTRRMMEVFYLGYVKKFPINELLCSKTLSNAALLLAPYMANFEGNQLLINDYGPQKNPGSWTITKFITLSGWSFRPVGAEQNPRGAKNEELRINIVNADDLDDDEVCRNPDRLDEQWKWWEKSVLPCVEIARPYFIFFDNNVIAEDCLALRASRVANDEETVNIRNEKGESTWPQKNSEEVIDEMLKNISYESAQGEYFNSPMSAGKTFPEIKWGKCPPLNTLPIIVVYADPATSNKDRPGQKSNLTNSRKAAFIIGCKGDDYYIYYGFLDVMSNSIFMASLYECRNYINKSTSSSAVYYYIENNTLQDPFYEQVLLPLMYQLGSNYGGILPITPDIRKKPEKWPRIEALLEPLNRFGHLIFNIDERANPHMVRLEAQFKSAKPTSKQLDGPDAIEGGVYILKNKIAIHVPGAIEKIGRKNKKRY